MEHTEYLLNFTLFFFFGNLSLVNSDGGGGQGSGKSAGCGHDHNIHISVSFWGQTEDRLDRSNCFSLFNPH